MAGGAWGKAEGRRPQVLATCNPLACLRFRPCHYSAAQLVAVPAWLASCAGVAVGAHLAQLQAGLWSGGGGHDALEEAAVVSNALLDHPARCSRQKGCRFVVGWSGRPSATGGSQARRQSGRQAGSQAAMQSSLPCQAAAVLCRIGRAFPIALSSLAGCGGASGLACRSSLVSARATLRRPPLMTRLARAEFLSTPAMSAALQGLHALGVQWGWKEGSC